jgi:Putative auto-transporter adhesin, head GIN domain
VLRVNKVNDGRRGTPGALLLAIPALLVLAGCSIIGNAGVDNGPVRSEARDVAGFSQVAVGGGAELTITIAPGYRVEITAEDGVLAKLQSRVEGDRLVIGSTEGSTSRRGVQVRISMPALTGLELSGGAAGRASAISGKNLALVLSGGAQVTLDGSMTRLSIWASGGSQAHLRDVAVEGAEISASGGSSLELTASGRVTGSASGGARVDVWGGGSISVAVSGGAQANPH